MGIFIFNDLSLQKNYVDILSLKNDLKELVGFYDYGKNFGHTVYLHRDAIKQVSVLKISFHTALNDNRFFTSAQRAKIFAMLDKSSPVLPDDATIPSAIVFYYEEQAIPNTGLAECAYQVYMEEPASAYSLSTSCFQKNILSVLIKYNDTLSKVLSVENYFSLSAFNQKLQSLRGPMRSWEDFFSYFDSRYKWIEYTDEAKVHLEKQAFEQILADAIISRMDILEQMAAAQSEDAFRELEEKRWYGDRAWFSDESDTRKRELKNKLTFMVNGVSTLCSYHGKISHRTFRIHFTPRPRRSKKIYIAYIGYKIN